MCEGVAYVEIETKCTYSTLSVASTADSHLQFELKPLQSFQIHLVPPTVL